jgi:dipeptidyl aminopeptidase/acylaminoacyl peptidase
MARSFKKLDLLALHGGMGAFAAAVSSRAFAYQWSLGHCPPRPLLLKAASTGISGLHDVTFESERGVVIHGWQTPTHNSATVILAHGSDANRSQLVPEARTLADAGFGVLVFDWPGQGESGGRSEWGRAERVAMEAAVMYLEQHGDLERGPLGAFGYSFGGIYVAQVAAQDPRVRAVALCATPNDLDDLRRWEHRRWGLLSQQSGLLAAHLIYGENRELEPARVIARVAPRPLLLIEGSADQTVPEFMTQALFAAAREPKTLYVVAGARHDSFNQVAPEAYPRRLREFFEHALL